MTLTGEQRAWDILCECDFKDVQALPTKYVSVAAIISILCSDPKNYKLKVTKDGGDVDAITAATITSRAFCDAVDREIALREENERLKNENTFE